MQSISKVLSLFKTNTTKSQSQFSLTSYFKKQPTFEELEPVILTEESKELNLVAKAVEPRSKTPDLTNLVNQYNPETIKIVNKLQKKNSIKLLTQESHLVTVNKWVNYSVKYGYGFILSDSSIGVCFNDNTKIVA